MKTVKNLELRIQNILSHHPKFYAFIVGIGIVLFWRGVWHSVDNIHTLIDGIYSDGSTSIMFAPWWDGPLSLCVGVVLLSFTGAFTSSFIGNELILSGLRGEKKLTERNDAEIKDELSAISDIQKELVEISKRLEDIEKQAHKNHKGL